MRWSIYLLTLLTAGTVLFSQQRPDSLLRQFEWHIQEKKYADADMDLYQLRLETGTLKPLKAIDYFRKAQAVAESHDQHFLSGRCYSVLGNFYYDQELYFQAMDYYINCYQLYRSNGLDDSLGYVFIDIGNVYYAQGLYELPEEYYFKSANVFSKIKNSWGLAVAYNNIALVNQRKERWDTASYFFHEALRIREEMQYPYLIAHSFNHLGHLFRLQKQYDKAEEYIINGETIALSELRKSGNQFDRANMMDILAELQNAHGLTNKERGRYQEAISHYLSAVKSFGETTKNIGKVINIHLAIGEIYRITKDWKNAESYARKALELSEVHQRPESRKNGLLLLSGIFSDQGRKPEALDYLQQYAALVQQESEQNHLSKISDYQSILKDYENQIQRSQTKESLQLRKTENIFLLTGLIGVSLIGFMFYRFYRSKLKTSRELEEKNKHITEQTRKLEKEIEDRKAAEFQVRKLVTAIEQSANTVVITDIHGMIEYVNPRFTEVTGYTAEEAIGKNPRILKSELKKPEEYTLLWKTILSGQVWRGLFQNKKKDGSEYWEEATISPIRNTEGVIEHFIAVKEDVTERNRILQELKESESRYRELFENSPGLICIHDLEGVITAINPAATRALGYVENELVGKNIGDLVTPANRDRFPLYLRQIRKHKKNTGELHLQSKDQKSLIWLYNNILIEEAGHTPYILGHAQDITAMKKLEEDLIASEKNYRTLFERMRDGFYRTTPDGRFIDMNPAYLQMYGYASKEEMMNLDITHALYFSQEDREEVNRLSKQGKLTTFRQRKKDGSEMWVEDSGYFIKDERGAITYHEGILRDVTQRIKAEEALQASETRYRYLIENINDVLFSVNPEGFITYISKAMLNVSGYKNTDVLGLLFTAFVHPEDTPKAEKHFRTVLSGRPDTIELRVYKKTKELLWISVSSSPTLQDDHVAGVHGILTDISTRKTAENIKQLDEIRLNSLLDLSLHTYDMSESEIIQNALEKAELLTNSRIGYCHFINEDQQSIELVTWSAGTLKACAAVHEKHYPLSQAGVWADCVRKKAPVIHNDYPNLTYKKGLPSGHAELIRHLSVPVIEEGQSKLIMGVGNKETNYDDVDVRQLQLIANETWKLVRRKRLESEREKIIRELQEALSKVKTLSGLLPICASCKKIRDDKGYWHQIENYIASHSDADFSHSICKECQLKLYPELFKDEIK